MNSILNTDIISRELEPYHLGNGLWLMDNHRWALKVWDSESQYGCKYTLIHADYHWDGIYDFEKNSDNEANLIEASSAELELLIRNDELIRYDSFIAPAVIRGLIDKIYFFCLQNNADPGINPAILEICGAKQVFHDNPKSLADEHIDRPLIFDLCLDLFNKSDQFRQGDLWTDEEIISFLDSVSHHIANAQIVTLSMSFDYSGSPENTAHLTKLVVPKILSIRASPLA